MSVGPTRGPVMRPGEDRDVTEIFQRLDDLERIAPGWRFNFDNEGGSGYVQTNDCVDLDAMPDPLAVGGNIGLAFEDDSGCGVLVGSNDADTTIKARNSTVNLIGDGVEAFIGNAFNTFLAIGSSFTIYDHNNDPLFTVTEAGQANFVAGSSGITLDSTGPIDIATSGNSIVLNTSGITASLASGDTLTVKDSGGNPIFEIDEATGNIRMKTGATITANL